MQRRNQDRFGSHDGQLACWNLGTWNAYCSLIQSKEITHETIASLLEVRLPKALDR
jgi:hypothetical protein